MERDFSVLNGTYVFKFEKKKGMYINEMDVWMHKNSLFWANSVFKQQRIESLEDLEDFDGSKVKGD
jgi:hypothetical protein